MNLKPQDIVILLKLVSKGKNSWSYSSLSKELSMSTSEVHAGIKRAEQACLINHQDKKPVRKALEEFLIHGVKYAFPPERGGETRGVATGFAAAPLNKYFSKNENNIPPVWPDPMGDVKGFELMPLYHSVNKAVKNDPVFYELLALVDAIREGKTRERELAITELKKRLSGDEKNK